jgi:hypothetical protein
VRAMFGTGEACRGAVIVLKAPKIVFNEKKGT